MASGRLGTARLAADTPTSVYVVPASTLATINILAVNQGTASVRLNVAISETATPAVGDVIEACTLSPNGGVLERGGIVVSAGEQVVCTANKGDVVDIRVTGVEGGVL